MTIPLFALLLGVPGEVKSQQVYTVTNTNNSGAGSLRQAISDMNSIGASPNEIRFQIAPSSQVNIQSQLPAIQRSVIVNSTNVPGIVLHGGGGSGNGLTFAESTIQGSEVRLLTIRNFSANGLVISPAANEFVLIRNCNIRNNGLAGISITNGRNHAVMENTFVQSNAGIGIVVGSTVQNVNISDSVIQLNQLAGVELMGTNHEVSDCVIVVNGQAESEGGHFGGIVFGGNSASATDCNVTRCTLAGNTPYGAQLVAGAGNKLIENETYLNTTKGF